MTSMYTTLADRVILVTGTSSGIGRAIAELFTEAGARVYGVDLDGETGRKMEAVLNGGTGAFRFHALDLLEEAAINAWVDGVHSQEGRVDVLCNVAGVSQVCAIEDTDEAVLARTLGVNLLAPYRMCRRVAPLMKRAGSGVIVNVASELAFVAQPGFTAYCASKGALVAFTRALALELMPYGVRVNALCPGPVDTPMLQAEFDTESDPAAARADAVSSIPAGRLGRPEEIARVALFMIGEGASFMQGAAIMVDGGKTLI